jgi:hypothetical protein
MQETSGTCTIYRKFGYCRVCQHDLDELQATAETSERGSYLVANNQPCCWMDRKIHWTMPSTTL